MTNIVEQPLYPRLAFNADFPCAYRLTVYCGALGYRSVSSVAKKVELGA
jgi:hypothetical protein